MSTFVKVMLVILVILIIALIVLYFVGKRLQKKQEASLPIIRRECLVCIDYSRMPPLSS